VTTLVLVRHGQASFGARNYDELSPLGHRQSELLGAHWRAIGWRADAWYSGHMQRQKSTGVSALTTLGVEPPHVEPHAAFDEYDHQGLIRAYLPAIAADHPEFAGDRAKLLRDSASFQRFFSKVIACWLEGRGCDEALKETWEAFRDRCMAGVREVARDDREQVVAFTSGGFITVALMEALKLGGPAAFEANWHIYNASVHTFSLGSRGLALTGFNNISHLQLARDPALLTFR
jgi:broad specificity phosphatase PhoE